MPKTEIPTKSESEDSIEKFPEYPEKKGSKISSSDSELKKGNSEPVATSIPPMNNNVKPRAYDKEEAGFITTCRNE